MNIKNWNIEEMTGYKPMTTYYQDFGIAEQFGLEAVRMTFDTEMQEGSYARSNYKVFTEFIIVLNWKIWEHYNVKPELAELYNELWQKADEFAMQNLKGEELKYYIQTTD